LPGEWTFSDGAATCEACQKGYYRTNEDVSGCLKCKTEENDNQQFLCDKENMTWPKAAAGFYVEWPKNVTASLPVYSECSPFEACVGGVQTAGCAVGYRGNRCARCLNVQEAKEEFGDEANPPGYYRRDGACHGCPQGNSMPIFIAVGLMLVILALVFVDKAIQQIDHFGTYLRS
jgi:hypothetical protein